MVYEWEAEAKKAKRTITTVENKTYDIVHQTIRNLDITADDGQDRDRWITIISGKLY